MKRPKLGALGTHSQGKVAPNDEGDLMLALTVDHKHRIVRIDFGKELTWIGLDANTAKTFAMSLLQAATSLDRVVKQ